MADERPNQWIQPRAACIEHKSLAVLESGELVDAFMERRASKEHPFEGSGLNYLINPVFINGLRGWNDFAGGGRAVFEEMFPSQNYFEYYAQHNHPVVDVFYALYKSRDKLKGEFDFKHLVWLLDTEEKLASFSNLESVWLTMREIEEALTLRGKARIESPDEAIEIWQSRQEIERHSAQIRKMVAFSLELGKSRFSYLKN